MPGLTDLVAYEEVSTPLTLKSFTSWPGGAFYGVPMTPERFKLPWLGASTPIGGLYLTGTDAASPGVCGALMGGLLAVGAALGPVAAIKMMRVVTAP